MSQITAEKDEQWKCSMRQWLPTKIVLFARVSAKIGPSSSRGRIVCSLDKSNRGRWDFPQKQLSLALTT